MSYYPRRSYGYRPMGASRVVYGSGAYRVKPAPPSTKVVYVEKPAKKKTSKKSSTRAAKAPASTPGIGSRVGAWLGNLAESGVRKITGLGAYEITKNSLIDKTGDQVPFMHSAKDGVRIRHREFIQNISSSVNFTNTTFSCNPGLSATFPWLAAIAQNFEEYKFEGLCFQFKSTSADALNSTNTALGTVVSAAEYNPSASAYVNKQQMENSMWAMSTKPSESMIVPIECAPQMNPNQIYYVRTGSVSSQDLKFYDLCNIQFATVGSQAAAVIGELWVTYDVVLMKPQQSSGLNLAGKSAHFRPISPDNTSWFGSTRTVVGDYIGLTLSPNGITFPLGSQGNYLITQYYVGGSAAVADGTALYTNCSAYLFFAGSTQSYTSNNGITGTVYIRQSVINIPDPTLMANFGYFNPSGTLPTSVSASDIVVVQLNGNQL